MCGIGVHFNSLGQASPLDLGMIHHRGPDSRGEWRSPDGRCWLGATRLAIVDLSPTGAQPMTDSATGNVIVTNGEIYNHLTVREKLGRYVEWRGPATRRRSSLATRAGATRLSNTSRECSPSPFTTLAAMNCFWRAIAWE